MTKWLGMVSAIIALGLWAAPARAEFTPPPRAGAGASVSAGAGAGARAGAGASVSAGASVRLPPVPVLVLPAVPSVTVETVRVRHRRHHRSSGQGMLIGGSIVTAVGVGSLVWGIERVKKTSGDAAGILLTVHGGVCMAVGLPLTIVGIALVASRGKKAENEAERTPRVEPTATGLAVHF